MKNPQANKECSDLLNSTIFLITPWFFAEVIMDVLTRFSPFALKKSGYPLKPGHLKVSMGYEQQDDEPFLAKEVRPFGQPTFQKGQGIGC